MNRKHLNMKHCLVTCMCFLFLSSCSDPESFQNVQKSEITAVIRCEEVETGAGEIPVEPELAFTEDEIAWFNPDTREIKFSKIESELFSIPTYAQVDIKLADETLFTIVAHVNATVSRAYDDMVLFYDFTDSRYYLYDNYPSYWNPEATEANRLKREKNWNRFLKQLDMEGRIK